MSNLEKDYAAIVEQAFDAPDKTVRTLPRGDVEEMERRGWLRLDGPLVVLGTWSVQRALSRYDPGGSLQKLEENIGKAWPLAKRVLAAWKADKNRLVRKRCLESWAAFTPDVLLEAFQRFLRAKGWQEKPNRYFLAICRRVAQELDTPSAEERVAEDVEASRTAYEAEMSEKWQTMEGAKYGSPES